MKETDYQRQLRRIYENPEEFKRKDLNSYHKPRLPWGSKPGKEIGGKQPFKEEE